MAILNSKLLVATAMTMVLAGCGGSDDTAGNLPADGDVSASVEDAATDAATSVENATAEAANAIDDATDTAAANAQDMVDQATDATANAADATSAAIESGWTDLKDNWQDSIASVKDRWSELTDEELANVNGDRDGLVSLLQSKYGMDRESAEEEVDNWASTL